MLRVIRNHRRAAQGHLDRLRGARACRRWRSTTRTARTARSLNLAHAVWDEALELGEQHGYRNAQVTVIAPTGTIGLVMDCDTTGIEPDFALVKFKKLAGGGYFKIINQSVPPALVNLGYRAGAGRGDRRLRRRPRHARRRAGDQPDGAASATASTTAEIAQDRGGAADRLRHPLRLQPVDARRGVLHAACSASRPRSCATRPSTCCATSASPARRSRRPTTTSAAR